MPRHWRVSAFDGGRVRSLAQASGVTPVVAQLLISRGFDQPSSAREFLDAKLTGLRDPELLPGTTRAASRILKAVEEQRRITVYGDYDADGITATALLVRCLRLLGADVDYYIPNRLDEGYGLNADAIARLIDRGTQLVITVDCGIASVDEAEIAHAAGLELIVTDHHLFGARLPRASAVIHPALPESDYPFTGLCGAGVAFKLAWQLCRAVSGSARVEDRFRAYLLRAVGLAAIGTVADVVPLLDENRLIVRHGLQGLKAHPVAGIAALLEVAKLDVKPNLTSEDIAFAVSPRLNAAGRLGQALLGVELLTTDCPRRAGELAEFLNELNRERDGLESSILFAARKQLASLGDPAELPAIILGDRGWHLGVIGIVAGRMAERHQRPCLLVSFDDLSGEVGTGSGRSALGIDLYEALKSCEEYLVRYGGHAAAAGLKVKRCDFERFRHSFCAHVDRLVPVARRQGEIEIDAETPLAQLTLRTVDQMQLLAPFGQANPRPLLCATGVTMDGDVRCMGEGNRHLSLRLRQHSVCLRAVAFGQGEWAEKLREHGGAIDVAYRPTINEYNGRRSVELHLVDWRPTE